MLSLHHVRLPVHVPADAVLYHRHRSRRWSRPPRRWAPGAGAVLAHLAAAAGAGLAINFCLSFVQTFSVFPSAVLLGAPAGPTRVISIAAYQAAYEQYDYSMASAIAMIMGVRAACRRRRWSRRARLVLSRRGRRRERLIAMDRDNKPSVGDGCWAIAIWALVIFFILNLIAMIAAVVVNSFAHALAQHLAAGRLHDAMVHRRPGTSSSSTTC